MDDFGNDLYSYYSTASEIEQWLISTSTYGGFGREPHIVGWWSRSEQAEI